MPTSNHMRPVWASLLAMLFALVAPSSGGAEALRRLSLPEHAQWQAIGRVNQAGFKSKQLCSGTLVAPDWVLTAAHCLISQRSDPFVFVAGWVRGDFAASREIVEILFDPTFKIVRPVTDQMVAQDIALARLARPIENVPPIPVAVPDRLFLVGQVDLISYSGAVPHMLSIQEDCTLRRMSRLVADLGCTSVPGNSGGPMLRETASGWTVVGVVSAGRLGQAVTKGSLMRASVLRHVQDAGEGN